MALGNASLTLSKFQVWSGTFLSLVAAENDISLSSIPRYLTVLGLSKISFCIFLYHFLYLLILAAISASLPLLLFHFCQVSGLVNLPIVNCKSLPFSIGILYTILNATGSTLVES